MTADPAGGLGVELLPDWTPSKNPRLARFDAVVKVAAGVAIPARTELRVRLLGEEAGPQVITSSADLGGLTGPTWRQVRGRLVDIQPAVSAAEGLLATCVSVPVFRQDAKVPVSLRAIRDMIGMADEPLLWWRYYNATDEPVNVRSLRAQTVLWADGRWFRLTGTYNGPAELPPGRAMSGLWSVADLEGLPPGTYRMKLVVGDQAADPLTVTLA